MKWISKIFNRISRWLRKENNEALSRERFIESIIKTHAFSKLTIQDKVLSVGRLITLFRSDNGFTPESLERTMESLNRELSRKVISNWDQAYSK